MRSKFFGIAVQRREQREHPDRTKVPAVPSRGNTTGTTEPSPRASSRGRSRCSRCSQPKTTIEGDKVIVLHPDGRVRVPVCRVIRWELPPVPTPVTPGQRVRLKGTDRTYTLVETYRVYCGRGSDGQPIYEQWARLTTTDGKPAAWKLNQLEQIFTPIEPVTSVTTVLPPQVTGSTPDTPMDSENLLPCYLNSEGNIFTQKSRPPALDDYIDWRAQYEQN